MQGAPAILHQPQPLLHKKGLQTTPQTPRQSFLRPFGSKRGKLERARGLTENHGRPLIFRAH